MALKLVIAKLEDVAENLRSLYTVGGDGKYHLDAEEDEGPESAKAKLKEFRDNNIKLMQSKEALEKQLKDIGDPAEIEKMKKKIQQLDDKQLLEAGKLDELVAQKTDRMRQDYETRIAALEAAVEAKNAELSKTTEHLSSVLIDSEITRAVSAVGIPRKGAMQDLIARGKRVFRLEDGKPVPKEGDKILYGKDAKAPMTFDEWAAIQAEQSPFLFESSSGSGGKGGTGTGKVTGDKEALRALPAQARLQELHRRQTAQQ